MDGFGGLKLEIAGTLVEDQSSCQKMKTLDRILYSTVLEMRETECFSFTVWVKGAKGEEDRHAFLHRTNGKEEEHILC